MDSLFAVKYSYLIPLLPLIGAAIAGFGGSRILKGASHWPVWIGVGASAVLSLMLLAGTLQHWHETPVVEQGTVSAEASHAEGVWTNPGWFNWIQAGDANSGTRGEFLNVHAGAWIDPLSVVMLCVVTCIGFLITVFSAGYMKGELGYFRFFAFMGLFIFAMTVLVMADNFILMYLGWEGVGLCSYLLIGYYYERTTAREAARKAFVVNRVGDFGFSIGIMVIFLAFGTVSFFGGGAGTGQGVLEMAMHPSAGFQQAAVYWIPFLLMLGAFGKSAQIPLYVWLPDAMEGPTPVSALIHAATMVTAGVYMIARCSTLFFGNHAALMTIAIVGAATAAMAAAIALRQFDLKKILAYSTISQLGYMFVAMGVLTPVGGVFHLVTHAFFKALLFLSAGVVMHAMAGELDMRKMSGLKRVLPWTNWFMLIGCLALAGFPLLSGFFSKDQIIDATFAASPVLGVVMLGAAFVTAYYTFRMYFRVFQGPLVIPEEADAEHGNDGHGHEDGKTHSHEPLVMWIPLAVLSVGAVFAGYLNWPEGVHGFGAFLAQSPSFIFGWGVASTAHGMTAHASEFGRVEGAAAGFTPLMGISAAVSIAGILLAYVLHLRSRAAGERLAAQFGPLTRLLEGKFWVDEVYQAVIVGPLHFIGQIFYGMDRLLVDGMIWLISFVPQAGGFVLKLTTQRGYLQGYAASMLFGVAIILLLIFL